MIQIPLTQKIVDYSAKLVNENNFGQRGVFDGSKRKQFIGVVAENTIRHYLDIELMKPKGGFDGGWDIIYKGLKTDIKCTDRVSYPKLHFANNIWQEQVKYKNEAYIFSSLHYTDKVLTICGWIDKEDFKKRAVFYKKGTIRKKDNGDTFPCKGDYWEILNSELNNFE